ncbi:hypothetical protein [Pseudoalteromonas piscicida]
MKKKAFVLMPFSAELQEVYEYLIKEGLKQFFEVKRADDIRSQGSILKDIVQGIESSDLILADLTDSNPNVYYELGIAHSLQKKVILITQSIDDLPFDLRSYRVIPYTVHFTKMNEAKQELKDLAEGAYKGTIPFGNPVKDYCSTVSFDDLNKVESLPEVANKSELGLLDHHIEIEEKFNTLTELVSEVGHSLTNDLVPKINESTKRIESEKQMSAKARKEIVVDLAEEIDNFASLLSEKNDIYRALIKSLESNIEFVLTETPQTSEEDYKKNLEIFLTGFQSMEESAMIGRDGFAALLHNVQ